jgi:hypothetical protein
MSREVGGMRMSLEVQFAALFLAASLAHAAEEDHIGMIKSLAGEVVVDRAGRTIKAEPNLKLYLADVVKTGADGKTGLILEDDTVISMGFNSSLALKSFQFKPNEKKLSFIARVYQGTVTFISGQIAKLAPSLVHIETPHATVGVRGTHVLIKVD